MMLLSTNFIEVYLSSVAAFFRDSFCSSLISSVWYTVIAPPLSISNLQGPDVKISTATYI